MGYHLLTGEANNQREAKRCCKRKGFGLEWLTTKFRDTWSGFGCNAAVCLAVVHGSRSLFRLDDRPTTGTVTYRQLYGSVTLEVTMDYN